MFPTLQLGPLAIQTPGLILLLALWLGLALAEKRSARHGVHPETLYNLTFAFLIAAALGGRLVYALRFPSAFAASPLNLLSLNIGLFDPWGAAFVGLLGALWYGRRKRLTLWPTLDALTPALAVLALGLGLSHLASGDAFGAPTTLPWGLELWGEVRHPSQVYETLAATGILLYVVFRKPAGEGRLFLEFLAASAGARLFLEAFRGDSFLLPNGWRVAQVAALFILGAALILRERRPAR